MKAEYDGPIVVTVTRQDTGEVLRTEVLRNDFFVICQGNRYVKSWQYWGRTCQLNIATQNATAPKGGAA